MALNEKNKHDLLLVITVIIFLLFSTGIAIPGNVPVEPVIVGL